MAAMKHKGKEMLSHNICAAKWHFVCVQVFVLRQFTLWLVVVGSNNISCIPGKLFQFLHLFRHCLWFTYDMIFIYCNCVSTWWQWSVSWWTGSKNGCDSCIKGKIIL